MRPITRTQMPSLLFGPEAVQPLVSSRPQVVRADPCQDSEHVRIGWRKALRASTAGVLIGFLGIVFRSVSLRMYSPLPADFNGPYYFRAKYLVEHHHFLVDQLHTYSYWSGGVNTQLGFYLMEAILGGVLRLSSISGIQPTLLHQVALTSALITLTTLLLAGGKGRNFRVSDVLIVTALITLGTPVVINYIGGWNSAYGWLLLLGVALASTSKLAPSWKLVLTFLMT